MTFEQKLNGPIGSVLAPLGWVFARIAAARVAAYHCEYLKSARPPMPTLSVGNISAGGTGKTPLLFAAIEWLEKHGASVGVLSRGYGGDEGRMLKERYPSVHLVEGADRVSGLQQMLAANPPELLLLDDGFQHLRIQRDVDIVVIDATCPFGRCFPAGLFRESTDALKRADLIVLSRTEFVAEARLEEIWAQIQQARGGQSLQERVEGGVHAQDLRNLKTGEVVKVAEFHQQRVQLAAGIGNPSSFRKLCENIGMRVQSFTRFGDHHAWNVADCQAFVPDLPLVVTEKDGVKLRAFASDQMWELRVNWQFARGFEVWERCLTNFHLPVRAAQIEPLWAAQDPNGRGGQ